MENNKLVLIDGSSLLTTRFFATAPRGYVMAKTEEEREKYVKDFMMTSKGVITNAVYGFIDALLSIIEKQKPTHLAVAWDVRRDSTWRRNMYSNYKGSRSETKRELKEQFLLAQSVLARMNIAQYMSEGFEADDIVGTLAKKFEAESMVYIWAKDQDVLQLVSDRIRHWYSVSDEKAEGMYKEIGLSRGDFKLPDGCFEFTPESVEHFYGLKPIQIIDKKALEGDKSDDIPGVKGIGVKSSVPLLQEFGTVENLYEFLEDTSEIEAKMLMRDLGIKRPPYSNLMVKSEVDLVGKESASLSKKLATIVTDVPSLSHITLGDLEVKIDENGRDSVFHELEFKSLLKGIHEKTA